MYKSSKSNMKILETKRCILRLVTLQDAPYLFDYYSQDIVTKYLPFNTHKNIYDTRKFINNFFIKNYEKGKIGHYAIILKKENKVIGNIGFNNISVNAKKGEIGICINPSYWGYKLGSELTEVIIRYGFEDLNLQKIEAITYDQNKYSQKPLLDLGFKFVKTSSSKNILYKQQIKSYNFEITKNSYLKRNDKIECRHKQILDR